MLAINTGMNRIGVRWDEVVNFMHQIGFHRALELEGVFTHFATADCPETLDFHIQAKRYIEAVEALRAAGINPGIVHCANSAPPPSVTLTCASTWCAWASACTAISPALKPRRSSSCARP